MFTFVANKLELARPPILILLISDVFILVSQLVESIWNALNAEALPPGEYLVY
jgi:hypothetical protein